MHNSKGFLHWILGEGGPAHTCAVMVTHKFSRQNLNLHNDTKVFSNLKRFLLYGMSCEDNMHMHKRKGRLVKLTDELLKSRNMPCILIYWHIPLSNCPWRRQTLSTSLRFVTFLHATCYELWPSSALGTLCTVWPPSTYMYVYLCLYMPPPLRPEVSCHTSVTMWLVKWLLFRLMFASGVVKLTSHCPTWWGLTALNYHYESQVS